MIAIEPSLGEGRDAFGRGASGFGMITRDVVAL
jgi:hypothetical protein